MFITSSGTLITLLCVCGGFCMAMSRDAHHKGASVALFILGLILIVAGCIIIH